MSIDSIPGQSGAGMLEMHLAFPRCSFSAARIVRMSRRINDLLANPRRSPYHDRELLDLSHDLRLLARDYIDCACQDQAAMARRSREVAAGLRFSSASAEGGFCQAGVVAPPDSPGFGKNASMGG